MTKWYKAGDDLVREIQRTSVQSRQLALWYIGQCGYILKSADALVMIDPVLNDICENGATRRLYPAPFAPDALQPDYVLCTHGHIDHMAPPTVSAIAAAYPGAKFILPAGCITIAEGLGIRPEQLIPLAPDCTCPLPGGLTVSTFSAAHPLHIRDLQNTDMALSCCIDFDGIRVLHMGDTYLTPELLRALQAQEHPHIFLPPINGNDVFRAMRNCIGNMEPEEAAKLAVRLGADLSIPCHYDMIMDNTVDPLRFAAELRRLNPAAKWAIPALGQRILYYI